MNDLEKEFEMLKNTVGRDIESKIDEANTLIREAQELSEEHKLPFRASLANGSRDNYIPAGLKSKWGDFVKEVCEETETYQEYGDGWQTSYC